MEDHLLSPADEEIQEYAENVSSVYTLAVFSLVVILASVLLGYYTRLSEFVSIVNKIPGPDQHPLMNVIVPVISIFRNRRVGTNVLFTQCFCGYTILYGEDKGFWKFWSLYRPVIILTKAEVVETVINNTIHLDKSAEYYFMRKWLRAGLITRPGKNWKNRRRILTPAFHFRILDDFIPVFEEQSRILVQKLHSYQDSIVDIVPLMTLCTFDIICETAMGISVSAQKNPQNPYLNGLRGACETFTTRMTYPWLWFDFIFYKTNVGKKFRSQCEEMSNFVQNVIQERKKEMIQTKKENLIEDYESKSDGYYGKHKNKAFLDLLLYNHIVENELSLEDIEEEVHSIMFAGHDTTAISMSYALYLLGLHPEIQEKVHQELHSIFGDDVSRQIVVEDIKEMKYLECVLKETLRLYPSAPFVARKTKSDMTLDGYFIPRNSTCVVLIYMLHRRSEVFENPEVFNPDRFLPENCAGRHPFAYIPFSAGPRNCIGQRFALMEEKCVMANILRQFRVSSVDQRDMLHVAMQITLKPVNGLRLRFTPKY